MGGMNHRTACSNRFPSHTTVLALPARASLGEQVERVFRKFLAIGRMKAEEIADGVPGTAKPMCFHAVLRPFSAF